VNAEFSNGASCNALPSGLDKEFNQDMLKRDISLTPKPQQMHLSADGEHTKWMISWSTLATCNDVGAD
jgi:hypothetical protein